MKMENILCENGMCRGGRSGKLFKATTKDLPLQNDTPDRRRKISKESPLMDEASGIVIPNLFYPWSHNRKMPLTETPKVTTNGCLPLYSGKT